MDARRARSAATQYAPAFWLGGVLIALTTLVYAPVWHYGFVTFDDPLYIGNPMVPRGLTWSGTVWALTTGFASNWHPVTWLSHMADVELYGVNAGPHHVTNLVLHLANTIVLFALLYQMTAALSRSAFVAALFAVHPLHVESVAWIAERKDVLSMLFGLAAVWAYLRYVRRPGRARYLLVAGLFVLALASKPMLVTLPFVLLLLDLWPLGRFQEKAEPVPRFRSDRVMPLVLEKLPLIVLSLASSVVTFAVQRGGGAMNALVHVPFGFRLENAVLAYVAYVAKMLWPARLAVLYPYPQAIPAWSLVGAASILVFISVAVVRAAVRYPYLPAGWLWYLGTLVPVIGLVQVGSQPMADRYSYLSSIGIFIIVAWGAWDLLGRWRFRETAFALLAVVVVLVSAGVARRQVQYWSNGIVLWTHAVQVTDDNPLAHNNLGVALVEGKRTGEAIGEYSAALALRPDYSEAHFNLANALLDERRVDEALQHYASAVRTARDPAATHNAIGVALAAHERTTDAIAHFSEAVRLNPGFEEARANLALGRKSLGLAYAKQGQYRAASDQYVAALRDRPADAETHNNLGVVLAQQGRVAEAIQHFDEAVRLKPDYADARKNLARARGGPK